MNYRKLSWIVALLVTASASWLGAQQPASQPLKPETAPATQPAAPTWPQFNGPRGDNRSPDQGLLKTWPAGGPKLLWRYDKCGTGFSSVSFADGLIFTAGDLDKECQVMALDMDGKLVWSKSNGKAWTTPWSGARSTPTYNDGLVYHLNAFGQLSAYEAKTGNPVWSVALKYKGLSQGGFAESVLIDGNNLICMPGDPDAFVIALDKKTGQKVWASDFKQIGHDRASYTSPILVDYKGKKHIICLSLFQLFSLDAQTGKVEWTVSHREETRGHCEVVAVSPIWLGDGKVFITKGYTMGSKVYAIDPSGTSVKLLWEHRPSDSEHAAAVADGGCVYVPGNYVYPLGGWNQKEAKEGSLYCLDATTGQEKWAAKIGRCTLTYADGRLYGLNEFGKLSLLEANPEKCTILGELQLPKMAGGWGQTLTHPVVFGGRLYVRNHNVLYVFDVKG